MTHQIDQPDYLGDIVMRCGDTLPLLAVAIEGDDGTPLDLTGASRVDFVFTHQDGDDPRLAPTDPPVVHLVLPGHVSNAVEGVVAYDWGIADLLRPGVINLVVAAYLPDGVVTAPTDRTAQITMRPLVAELVEWPAPRTLMNLVKKRPDPAEHRSSPRRLLTGRSTRSQPGVGLSATR